VLLRDVQMHPFRHEVLHVDFQRIDEKRKIHMKVPLHFVNEAASPAVKLGGAIISHIANELDVACLPKDLPEFIEVDCSTLESGKSIHVSEVKLPAGVVAVTHGKDPVVVTAVIPKAHVEEAEEATAEATAAGTAAAPAAAAPAAEKKEEKKEEKKDDKKK
jgi:large subunit ribosomal protein L25